MKQVLQDLKSGAVAVLEVPEPAPAPGRVLVRVEISLLSAGTENAQVAKARQSLLAKVREKPQLLRQGLEEFRERGLAGVRQRLASKFEGLAELGYSCAGVVIHSGEETGRITPGMRVACGGVGFANHAEIVSVPPLLTAPVPGSVGSETAAYATLAAIAMQGVRQAQVQLGEAVAVIGLGLVGLLAVQFLRAGGCKVVGIDPAEPARRRGTICGAASVAAPDQALEAVAAASGGRGVDAVIVCAATASSSPVELAGKIARSRGRVVMVGATGMQIPREDYYLKELSFTLSRSYGPGRYDPTYEEDGLDYPFDYVRFTEQRNLTAFLEMAERGLVDTSVLTTHRFPVDRAPDAYALLNAPGADRAGVLLSYREAPSTSPRLSLQVAPASPTLAGTIGLGFIGAGAYAQGMLLPILKARRDVSFRSVMTLSGSQGLAVARRFGFEQVCTEAGEVLANKAVDLVFVVTRHDSHTDLVCRALSAGKHVWVEKPLGLTLEELKKVWDTLKANPSQRLIVGFNRPFSQDAVWLKTKLEAHGCPMMLYRVNAGQVPANSWVNDPKAGGGRLLGEGCHFFDFLRWMAGAMAVSVYAEPAGMAGSDLEPTGNFAATVRFENGAVGQLLYSAQGASSMEKEHFELFTGTRCGSIQDYRSADFFRGNSREQRSRHAQDKGQAALLDLYLTCLRQGSASPVSHEDLVESSLITLAAQRSLLERRAFPLAEVRNVLI